MMTGFLNAVAKLVLVVGAVIVCVALLVFLVAPVLVFLIVMAVVVVVCFGILMMIEWARPGTLKWKGKLTTHLKKVRGTIGNQGARSDG